MTRKPDYVVNVLSDGFAYQAYATSSWSAATLLASNEYNRSVDGLAETIPYRILVYIKPEARENPQ